MNAHPKDRRKDSSGPALSGPRPFEGQSSLPQVIVYIDSWEIFKKLFKYKWNWECSVVWLSPRQTNDTSWHKVRTACRCYLWRTSCNGLPIACGNALYVVLLIGVPGSVYPVVPTEVFRVLSAQAQHSKGLSATSKSKYCDDYIGIRWWSYS